MNENKIRMLDQIARLTDDQIKYIGICLPEFIDIANIGIANEKKYGEGLHCSDNDRYKALGHMQKGIDGIVNPDDGSDGSEFRAAAFRAIKAMKFEKVIK